MAEKSRIEWTDATWNPTTGCTLISPGCKFCYAAELAAGRLKNHPSRIGLARRNRRGFSAFTGELRFNEAWLDQPLRWRKPRRIFVCAHSDLFHDEMPRQWIDKIFAVMACSPRHVFQILTKRPARMRSYMLDDPRDAINSEAAPLVHWDDMPETSWPLPNVWLGVSAEDQDHADQRIPALLETPAAMRFLSAEPLLGRIDVSRYLPHPWESPEHGRLDWIIAGGESGAGARPMHPDWPRVLRDQCTAARVPFFFKQWGEFLPLNQSDSDGGNVADDWVGSGPDGEGGWHEWPGGWMHSLKIGKRNAGRSLDGRLWSDYPGTVQTASGAVSGHPPHRRLL